MLTGRSEGKCLTIVVDGETMRHQIPDAKLRVQKLPHCVVQ